ncbi:Probable 2-oxoglutarate-dependent dioxygenase AOP1.2 [Linum perenne]
MGTECNPKLPFIDFSKQNLKSGTPDWEVLKSQVREALEEYGCFEASYDKVSTTLCSAAVESLEELFSLPLPIKLRNASKKPFHGYVGQYPQVPLYESMGIDEPNVPHMVETLAKTFWTQGNPKFRNYLLRVMKYKSPETQDKKLGLSSHTDKNIVTILYQNQVQGLEVQTKNGTWIKSQPSPTTFIVMIGDSLKAWLNGRLHSPLHRVMMSGNESRYSLGLFSVPKSGYIIEAPVEMVDKEHPLLFKPFDHVEFLSFYYSAAGQTAPSALYAYCGI